MGRHHSQKKLKAIGKKTIILEVHYLLYDNKPVEKGNALHFSEICSGSTLLMFKFEAIVDYYSEEPPIIYLSVSDDGSPYTFEQVLRIRQWIPNKETISWCIYSEDRNWEENEQSSLGGLIVRKVNWDRLTDQNKYKSNPKIERNDWPTLTLENFYLNPKNALGIINELKSLDDIIKNGILLAVRSNLGHDHKWNEFEIKRCFDWGSVQAVWHPYMTNQDLEILIERLSKKLSQILNDYKDLVFKMELDYTIPTIVRKKLVEGEKI